MARSNHSPNQLPVRSECEGTLSMKTIVRDNLAAMFRALPPFRGKGTIGLTLGHMLTSRDDAEGSGLTIRMKDGSLFRVDARNCVEQWAIWTGEYDTRVIRRLCSCLRPHSVVLDIGANIGFYSVPLARRLKNLGGRLYAFEPVAGNYRWLCEAVRLNHLEDVVVPIRSALGETDGIITLELLEAANAAPSTGNAIMLTESADRPGRCTAPLAPLDHLAREWGITSCRLIKIDVEGAELQVFRGARQFISEHRPIIYGEFWPSFMATFGHSFLDVAEFMTPLGYRMYRQQGRDQFVKVTRPAAGIQDVLLAPEEISEADLRSLGVMGDL